jgi:light-regulated signal transduction histidine kinase (bacteriophytochrome)
VTRDVVGNRPRQAAAQPGRRGARRLRPGLECDADIARAHRRIQLFDGRQPLDQRKNLEEEANAIGTEYVRIDLLPAADVNKVRALLTDYLDQRIQHYSMRVAQQIRTIEARTAQLQAALWAAVVAPAVAQPTDIASLVVIGMKTLSSRASTAASATSVCRSIAPPDLPHLFERFYRGSTARADAVPGMGLGLALSQAVARARGGRIDVANVPGAGAIFTLNLPLQN